MSLKGALLSSICNVVVIVGYGIAGPQVSASFGLKGRNLTGKRVERTTRQQVQSISKKLSVHVYVCICM